MQQFLTNRARSSPEELAKYAGQYVAWSPDGTRILASDAVPEEAIEAAKALGYDPGETVLSFVPSDDETLLAPLDRGGIDARGSPISPPVSPSHA